MPLNTGLNRSSLLLIFASLIFCGVFRVGVPLVARPTAFPAGPQIGGPGDINGDGVVDLADATLLMRRIFGDVPTAPVTSTVGLTPEQVELLQLFTLTTITDADGAEHPTVRLTGANLQIVNGLGATNGNPADPTTLDPAETETNGVGNLIVGYNEPDVGYDIRRGSHNVIVGSQLEYQRFGGLAIGRRSEIAGAYASVSGGRGRALGDHASVTGGEGTASGAYASITGGFSGVASGDGSTVIGGDNNEASGDTSTVTGGEGNVGAGYGSVVVGGTGNVSQGWNSVVGGGATLVALETNEWTACAGWACP